MGLDVSAYNKVAFIREYDSSKFEFSDNETRVVINKYFEHSARSLKNGLYSYETRIRQCMGAFSSYNQWRNQLAILAGFKSDEDAWNHTSGKFWELIYFSDCEGTLDQTVCNKLYQDFLTFKDKASKESEYFYKKYVEWLQLFEHAKDDGFVSFH